MCVFTKIVKITTFHDSAKEHIIYGMNRDKVSVKRTRAQDSQLSKFCQEKMLTFEYMLYQMVTARCHQSFLWHQNCTSKPKKSPKKIRILGLCQRCRSYSKGVFC